MTHFRLFTTVLAMSALLVVLAGRKAETHNPVTTTVLYNKEIAPIVFAKCAPCHFEGGPSMSLITYDEVRPWAQAIKEEILLRKMPPWSAKHGYGTFANDLSLTIREREFLLAWLDGGVPPGDGPGPTYVDHSAHWMLGSPDEIRQAVAEKSSRAAGGVRRFTVDTGFRTPQLVRAVDIKVDRRSTRAAFLSMQETGQYLGGWMPGRGYIELPAGVAFRLPAGARLAIDVISDPSEPASAMPPQIGIYLAERADAEISRALTVVGRVAAGERRARAQHLLRTSQVLTGFRVETDDAAKSVQLLARHADGSAEPLLWMRGANGWPVPFVFQEPVRLPAGTTLEVAADFSEPSGDAPRLVAVHFTAYEARTDEQVGRAQ